MRSLQQKAGEKIFVELLRDTHTIPLIFGKDSKNIMDKRRPFQAGKFFWPATVFIAVLTLAIGIWLGSLWQKLPAPLSPEQEKLEEIRGCIEDYYLFDTNASAEFNGICKGLVDSLGDPYASYYSPEELALFFAEEEGEMVGIGVVFQDDRKTNEICITSVLPGGPAAAAGIQVKDILLSVEDTPVGQMPFDLLARSITGEAGTQVSLTVYRPSTNESLTFAITREKVSFPSVEYRMLENQTGYLRISDFAEHLPDEFTSAMEGLESQGMEQLVVDLRNNPGGNLIAAVKVADYLLPDSFISAQGEHVRAAIVSLKDKNGNVEQYECADGNSAELPIVILVNEYSASASELFSSAMRDYGRGALVGVNTYGKGIAQLVLELSDGSAVKLTNMEYFTPSGFALHGVGLKPDVIMKEDHSAPDRDNQLEAAIQTLEEIRQGKRVLPILVDGKVEPETPTAIFELAAEQPCKTEHLPFTRQEMEALLPQLYANYGAGWYYRTDNWAPDEVRGYDRRVTLELSFDENIWIAFSVDPVTEELHQFELYLPTEQAVACTLDVLAEIDPSLTEAERNKLRETLPAKPMDEEKNLEEVLKKKNYAVYAGSEGGSLSVIIEGPA